MSRAIALTGVPSAAKPEFTPGYEACPVCGRHKAILTECICAALSDAHPVACWNCDELVDPRRPDRNHTLRDVTSYQGGSMFIVIKCRNRRRP